MAPHLSQQSYRKESERIELEAQHARGLAKAQAKQEALAQESRREREAKRVHDAAAEATRLEAWERRKAAQEELRKAQAEFVLSEKAAATRNREVSPQICRQ
eukprot:SAG11_NODE_7074_length_1198_cov_1.546861_1_plen_101_part_10